MADGVNSDLDPKNSKPRGRKAKDLDPAAQHGSLGAKATSASDPWASVSPATAPPRAGGPALATPAPGDPTGAKPAAEAAPKFEPFKTAGWFIGLIGLPVFAIIYGIRTLRAAGRGVEVNKAGGIAALVLGGAVALAVVVNIVVAALEPGTSRGVAEIHEGDCILEKGLGGSAYEVDAVRVIDCAEPHYGQVYYAASLPAGAYPGEAAVFDAVEEACLAHEGRIKPSAYGWVKFLSTLSPTKESWDMGERGFSCLALAGDGETFVGSVLVP